MENLLKNSIGGMEKIAKRILAILAEEKCTVMEVRQVLHRIEILIENTTITVNEDQQSQRVRGQK